MKRLFKKGILKEILIIIGTFLLATLLCKLLSFYKVDEANLIMIYVLNIIVIAAFTKNYIVSIVSTVISILLFNFFFTEPYYTFMTLDDKYPMIFVVMLIVGLVISTVMQKLKKQMEINEKNIRDKEAKQAIIEREKTRSDILRSITHDIRTPLTTIKSGIQQLSDQSFMDDENKKTVLKDLQSESDWLIMLVENMLSATKIENKALTLKKQPQLIEEIMSAAVEQAGRHKGEHTLSVSLPDEILTVNIDFGLILQVLGNLFDNAFKYSKKDSAVFFNAVKSGGEVILEVINTDSHIDEKDLPHIFEMFYTGKNVKDKRRGSGIGLAVCKTFVEAHGGTLTAKNLEDNSVSFSFNLKLYGGQHG